MHSPISRRRLGTSLVLLTGLAIAARSDPPEAHAADYGAKTSGTWSSSSTWTPTGVPGTSDTAYIGSTYPGGAAATATVMLTQNQQAYTVVLGYGTGRSGTLNMGNFNLTANALYLGVNGGTGAITRGTGSFDVGLLELSGYTLGMNGNDRVGDLILRNGSSVTTSATGDVSFGARVWSGSTLTLGATPPGGSFHGYYIEVSGANSTLDAQFNKITGGTLSIGWEYVGPFFVPGNHVVQFLNRGDLDVDTLAVANQNLNLTAADRVSIFALSNGSTTFAPGATVYSMQLSNGASATTTAVGNIAGGGTATVRSGSTLTLGAELNMNANNGVGYVSVEGNNSTLDAQGHKITAAGLWLGWEGGANVRLLNRGDIAVSNLFVGNQNFHLTATDQVTNFSLSNGSTNLGAAVAVQSLSLQEGATATTSAAGNLTTNVDVNTGSTLTLGANLNVSGIVQVYGDNSTLNAQGHKITADILRLGVDGGTNVRLLNKGELAITGELVVANMNLNLSAGDQVTNFKLFNGSTNLGGGVGIQSLYLQNSSATTTATGSLTGSVAVLVGSTLTLGANLDVGTNGIAVSGDNSTINAQGRAITAGTLDLGWNGGNNVQLLNDGAITVGTWYQGQGIHVELHDGNDTVQSLHLGHTSDLTIKSAATGFTIGGTTSDNLQFNGISTLTLELDGSQPGWVLRWANPEGGDHIADLNALIAEDFIVFSAFNGGEYSLVSQNGYTYVVQPVPEPALILLIAAPVAVGLYRRGRGPKMGHSKGESPTGIGCRCLRTPLILLIGLAVAALHGMPEAKAADYGAKTSGNWSSSSTWTPTGVPGSGDNVYIGSTHPGGTAATATVILTQNRTANSVRLGYGTGTSGTLNLGNFNLTANALYLGVNGGTGAVTRGTGSLNIGYLQLSASTLAMSANDRTEHLFLYNGSSVTTAATGNVSDGVRVYSGSTLTLGADLYSGGLWDSYNVEVSGANSTLDAQFHKISAPDLSIGWEYVNQSRVAGNHVVQFLNRGELDVGNLFVANQDLHLTAADRVSGFILSNGSTQLGAGVGIESLYLSNGATATTTAVGNITYHVGVEAGSTLTLGADLNVNAANGFGFVNVSGDNSTLDAQFHKITAFGLSLGWDGGANVRLLNRGDIAVTGLAVANQNFNLTPTDQVADFSLSNGSTTFVPAAAVQYLYLQDGATAVTSAAGNITAGVDVASGSTLTLGANLNVSGTVQVYGDNSTLNAQSHKITADTLLLGWDGGNNVRLLNKGELAVGTLWVANQNLNLTAADQVSNFRLLNGSSNLGATAVVQNLELWNGSTATTAVTGNLTGNVDVRFGSTLTLGADLSVSGYVQVAYGANTTLDAQFHKITADTLLLGYGSGETNVRLLNRGELAVTNLHLAAWSTPLNLSPADAVANLRLWGSTASTAASGNLTGSVHVLAGSTLTLGANLAVTGAVNVGLDNTTINAQGHRITAGTLSLGYLNGGENVRLLNRGNLAVTNLLVASQDFNLAATDQVTNFSLIYGRTTLGAGVAVERLTVADLATATTSTAGNITRSVDVFNVLEGVGSKLTLGADLTLSGHVNAYGHTITIDAQGRNITADSLSFEYAPGNPGLPNVRLLNDGAITIGGAMALAGGVQVELRNGNDTAQSLSLSQGSGLRIKSAATGFTIGGTTADDLLFNGTSTLTLELDGSQPGWVFRWANPEGGDHIAELNALIAENFIVFSVTNGGEYSLVSQNGYTYVVQPVPEPALILLIAAPVVVGLRRRRGPKKGHLDRGPDPSLVRVACAGAGRG